MEARNIGESKPSLPDQLNFRNATLPKSEISSPDYSDTGVTKVPCLGGRGCYVCKHLGYWILITTLLLFDLGYNMDFIVLENFLMLFSLFLEI